MHRKATENSDDLQWEALGVLWFMLEKAGVVAGLSLCVESEYSYTAICASVTTIGNKEEGTIKYQSDVEDDVYSIGESQATIIHITYLLREEVPIVV